MTVACGTPPAILGFSPSPAGLALRFAKGMTMQFESSFLAWPATAMTASICSSPVCETGENQTRLWTQCSRSCVDWKDETPERCSGVHERSGLSHATRRCY